MKQLLITLFLPLTTLAMPTIDQLRACDTSLREANIFGSRITLTSSNKDLAIVAVERKSALSLAADLYLYYKNLPYKVQLPIVERHCFAPARQMVVQLPDGDYCLHFKIACLMFDRVHVFEKMPSQKCGPNTDKLETVQVGDSAIGNLYHYLFLDLERQIYEFDLSKKDMMDKDQAKAKIGLQRYTEISNKFSAWNAKPCLDTNDPEITATVREIQKRVEASRDPASIPKHHKKK
jgi:hypothetical protein